MRFVVATANRHKAGEIKAILDVPDIDVVSLLDLPDAPELEETGATFEANARQKAEIVRRHYGLSAIADDSGLEVDALGGRPGIYSARYAGPAADDRANVRKLLAEMAGVPADKRTARFRTVAVAILDDGRELVAEGKIEGRIGERPLGEGGFGYDPVFVPAGHDVTMAQLTPEEKNAISHRGRAFRALRDHLLR